MSHIWTDRLTFYVPALDVDSEFYSLSDSDVITEDVEPRVIDFTGRANATSSWSAVDWAVNQGTPELIRHLPCIDVDIELNVGQRLVRDLMFPDVIVVASSTPGHHHWYSEVPLSWTEYASRLENLVECGIVAEEYCRVSVERGATFLRFPHVKKRVPA